MLLVLYFNSFGVTFPPPNIVCRKFFWSALKSGFLTYWSVCGLNTFIAPGCKYFPNILDPTFIVSVLPSSNATVCSNILDVGINPPFLAKTCPCTPFKYPDLPLNPSTKCVPVPFTGICAAVEAISLAVDHPPDKIWPAKLLELPSDLVFIWASITFSAPWLA